MLTNIEAIAAASAQQFKKSMNHENSLNSTKENFAALESAESALDALHVEAIETELQKLEQLEAEAQPAPWTPYKFDHRRIEDSKGDLIKDQREFVCALRNAAPKLIFQAKNIANIVADLDEVHAALGTDYNHQAAPDVRRLKKLWEDAHIELAKLQQDKQKCEDAHIELAELQQNKQKWEDVIRDQGNKIGNLHNEIRRLKEEPPAHDLNRYTLGVVSELKEQNERKAQRLLGFLKQNEGLQKRIVYLESQLDTEQTISENLRGTVAELRQKYQDVQNHRQNLSNEQDRARAEVDKLNRLVNGRHQVNCAQQERERQLLSNLDGLRKQNENLCRGNVALHREVRTLTGELSFERSEAIRLKGILDLAKKELEQHNHHRAKITEAKERLSDVQFLISLVGKAVKCSDGAVRRVVSVSKDRCEYEKTYPNGICGFSHSQTHPVARKCFEGGKVVND